MNKYEVILLTLNDTLMDNLENARYTITKQNN